MASIMIEAWRTALAAEVHSMPAIDAAYGPAARLHLLDAYGWQLLACQRVTQIPDAPPRSAKLLPEVASGIALSPEVREMSSMEENGWLAELMLPIRPGLRAGGPQNLLAVSSGHFDSLKAADIYRNLEALIDRVADAIDES